MLVARLDAAWYAPRTYVVAATDALGPSKAAAAEAAAGRKPGHCCPDHALHAAEHAAEQAKHAADKLKSGTEPKAGEAAPASA